MASEKDVIAEWNLIRIVQPGRKLGHVLFAGDALAAELVAARAKIAELEKGDVWATSTAEHQAARIAELERQRDDARDELGVICVACTLEPGEGLAGEQTTAACIAVQRVLVERDSAMDQLAEAHERIAELEKQRDAALALADEWDASHGALMIAARELRAALQDSTGSADVSTRKNESSGCDVSSMEASAVGSLLPEPVDSLPEDYRMRMPVPTGTEMVALPGLVHAAVARVAEAARRAEQRVRKNGAYGASAMAILLEELERP